MNDSNLINLTKIILHTDILISYVRFNDIGMVYIAKNKDCITIYLFKKIVYS